ncbi:three component ABC system middle component [Arthrobacter sp. AQ5-05]|uniref:three component ABC system middle component n=1 Tax=Arthrobacter sp. AQ5-05 TaxID=2184581 RepID=UPI001C65A511|nr:three component ABC system middle component [Arthrobacter sp. AQ5-05]
MTAWHERSRAEATMLNPALLAVVVANAASQYRNYGGSEMTWPLAFLVAPFVLHRGTREALPRSMRTNLGAWIADHPVEHAGFGLRALSLRDPVREGLRFGITNRILEIDNEGHVLGNLARGRGHTLEPKSEVQEIVSKAGFVGKWLTKVEQPATAFVLLGVAP